jgi:hypothetical protein
MGQDGQIRRDRVIIDTDPGIGAVPPFLHCFFRFGFPVSFPLSTRAATDENSVSIGLC